MGLGLGLYPRWLHWRRRLCEAAGIGRYSRMAGHDLDRKLERYLNWDGGVFIECGANDGVTFSNTYYLERIRRWRGLLIEGIPELAGRCRRNRPSSDVVNCALVPAGADGSTIEMEYANLMSVVRGALGDAEEKHLKTAQACEPGLQRYTLKVPGRALSALLDERGLTSIDFFSLDVEGFELSVLQGLDLRRHRPRWICVEARDRKGIQEYLEPWYELVDELTCFPEYADRLYRVRDPK